MLDLFHELNVKGFNFTVKVTPYYGGKSADILSFCFHQAVRVTALKGF